MEEDPSNKLQSLFPPVIQIAHNQLTEKEIEM